MVIHKVKHIIREKLTDKQGVEEVITGVILALTVEIDGELVTIEEAGDVEQPFNWKTDGARMKDAISDAVKRCAMALGVGLHLWSQFDGQSEYFLDKQLESMKANNLNNWDADAQQLYEDTHSILRTELARCVKEYGVAEQDWNNNARASIVERICTILPNFVWSEDMWSVLGEEE